MGGERETSELALAPELHHGECEQVLRSLADDSIDAVVTDPPYGISFMGKHWDRFAIEERVGKRDVSKLGLRLTGGHETPNRKLTSRTGSAYANAAGIAGAYDFTAKGNRAFQAWCEAWASECLRVLKPGGFLLSFGGTRTYHRLASGVEDAGFEIRDEIAWLFGSGFPKSRNLDGEHEGWGTALKPAHEPIVVARKPLAGTVAANVLEHGTGAINVDACRIGAGGQGKWATPRGGIWTTDAEANAELEANALGRWPANVVLDEEAAEVLDEQSGERKAGAAGNRTGTNEIYGKLGGYEEPWGSYGDTGGASRFFYCAKTSRAERNAGLDGFDARALNWSSGEQNPGSFQGEGTDRSARNHHPTVKPISLMRWLVRLVTPPGGIVLDPFLGSGTTGIAAALEGFEFVGIEREPDYLKIAEARIAFWREHGEEALVYVARAAAREQSASTGQLDLLAEEAP